MNKKMILLTAAFIGIVLVFAAMPRSAAAGSDNAAVSVLSAGLGAYCETYDFFDSYYYGPGTRVTKADGSINQTCAMQLVEGAGVSELTRFTYIYSDGLVCDFVATSGGTLNATCRLP